MIFYKDTNIDSDNFSAYHFEYLYDEFNMYISGIISIGLDNLENKYTNINCTVINIKGELLYTFNFCIFNDSNNLLSLDIKELTDFNDISNIKKIIEKIIQIKNDNI